MFQKSKKLVQRAVKKGCGSLDMQRESSVSEEQAYGHGWM